MGKVYFASDFHFGVPTKTASRERELRVIRWLEQIKTDAEAIYLVGDVFDFWFEYKAVVPKGFVRILGKLAELRDSGIPIYFFHGNHDKWMFHYFEEELNIPIYDKPIEIEIKGKQFFIGHGDGLGPKDYLYKFIKVIFSMRLFRWAYSRFHPNFGIGFASYWSRKSRQLKPPETEFLGYDNEWLAVFADEQLDKKHYDYFVFGHRHLPIDYVLKNKKSRYINLGEWLHYNSYAVFDGETMEIKFFENETGKIFRGI